MSAAAFGDYHQKLYPERWPQILHGLKTPPKKWAWINPFALTDRAEFPSQFKNAAGLAILDWEQAKPEPQRNAESGLLDFYVLDPASIQVAAALRPFPQDEVADICAAPGGKTLVLFGYQAGESLFVANELSQGRRENLQKIVNQYLPRDRRDNFFVKGLNAERFGLAYPEKFDKILVDVPCSGERHVLQSELATKQWSPKRSKDLARRQYTILCSAYLALREGGEMIYSTCSLNPAENDEVVGKLLKRKNTSVKFVKEKIDWISPEIKASAEETEFGFLFLPDRVNFGPMYFSKIRKG